jgi:hypothetical protein
MFSKWLTATGCRATFHLCLLAFQVIAAGALLSLSGCSTAPCADVLDFCSPGRFPADAKSTTGGVCIPQGGPAGGVLGGPPPGALVGPGPGGPVGPPGVPVIPPPAPIGSMPMPAGPK